MSVLFLILYVLCTSGGLVLLKLGTTSGLPVSFVDNAVKFNFNPLAIGGIFLYGLSFFLYIYLISKFQLGFIVPLTTALVYTLVFVASYFVFHEVFTILKVAAIALIVTGVILLSLSK
jgi:small multidrug resistance pump